MSEEQSAFDVFAQETRQKNEAAEQQQLEYERHVRLFHQVFSSGPGAQLLDLLYNLTVDNPKTSPQGAILLGQFNMQPAEFMFYREGQNSIVHYINSMLDQAENLNSPEGVKKKRPSRRKNRKKTHVTK